MLTHTYSHTCCETTDVIWSFQKVQHTRVGEMISDPGNHSFNYIFCSPLSSLHHCLPLVLSLVGFTLRPDVCHSAIPLMASSLPLSGWSNGNRIFLLRLSFHSCFIHSPPPPSLLFTFAADSSLFRAHLESKLLYSVRICVQLFSENCIKVVQE